MNQPTRQPVLDCRDLRFAYPSEPPLFDGWSRAIGPGVTQLFGDTGSGKTTLLRAIAGDLPAQGRLGVTGVRLDGDALAYRQRVFWCDPASEAFDRLGARECTAALSHGDAGFDAAEWQSLVDGFGLAPHLDKALYMLSTGSKRKLWLAAALASGRPLILLDEPAAALDGRSIERLWRALARFAGSAEQAVIVASAERIRRLPLAGMIELPSRD